MQFDSAVLAVLGVGVGGKNGGLDQDWVMIQLEIEGKKGGREGGRREKEKERKKEGKKEREREREGGREGGRKGKEKGGKKGKRERRRKNYSGLFQFQVKLQTQTDLRI